MAGGNLFGRALSYVVNEFLVEGLANKYACLPFLPSLPSELGSIHAHLARVSSSIWRQ
jgi:isocitrate dehydrogenase